MILVTVLLIIIFQADIMDVNTIFKDLSEMVQESGQVIGKFSICPLGKESSVDINDEF